MRISVVSEWKAFNTTPFYRIKFEKIIFMDAVIKVRPDELTGSFLDQLKKLAVNAKRIEIRLDGVDAINNLSEVEIVDRLQKLADDKTVSFTMEEFEAYVHKIAG